MPESDAPQLGRLAVERGLISEGQLQEALAEHGRRLSAGSQVPLGELFVELGFVTRVQLEVLVAAQDKEEAQKQPIEGFELIKKLGEGGMGATYLARQLSMDRLVALAPWAFAHSTGRQREAPPAVSPSVSSAYARQTR